MDKTVAMAEPEIVFTSKAAEMLDTSVATVNRMAREGRLVPITQGAGTNGARCYKRSDIDALRRVLLAEADARAAALRGQDAGAN